MYKIPNPYREPIRSNNGIGRNSPCLCGSGKKYKRCCGVKAPPIVNPPTHPPRPPQEKPTIRNLIRYILSRDNTAESTSINDYIEMLQGKSKHQIHLTYIGKVKSIDDINIDKPQHIFYGANTPWWTHNPCYIIGTPPTDPLGGMLFQSDDPNKFLSKALSKPEHYGRHGLRAFFLAHSDNMLVSFPGLPGPTPICLPNWGDYNNFIDAIDSQNSNR